MFYINLNCSKTNRRNSWTHVVSCSLTDEGLIDFLRLDAKLYDLLQASFASTETLVQKINVATKTIKIKKIDTTTAMEKSCNQLKLVVDQLP